MNDNLSDNKRIEKRNKFYGVLIIVVIALPMLLAYIMFKTGWGIPQETTNKGDLLTPARSVKELSLPDQSGYFTSLYASDKKKWRMMVPVTKPCEQLCEKHLYITRQVHIRLAEKSYRVERILLLLNEWSEDELEVLKRNHPNVLMVNSSASDLAQWLSSVNLPLAADRYFYLVDQDGFAMMRYSDQHSGQDLLDDIKKLLKFTYDK